MTPKHIKVMLNRRRPWSIPATTIQISLLKMVYEHANMTRNWAYASLISLKHISFVQNSEHLVCANINNFIANIGYDWTSFNVLNVCWCCCGDLKVNRHFIFVYKLLDRNKYHSFDEMLKLNQDVLLFNPWTENHCLNPTCFLLIEASFIIVFCWNMIFICPWIGVMILTVGMLNIWHGNCVLWLADLSEQNRLIKWLLIYSVLICSLVELFLFLSLSSIYLGVFVWWPASVDVSPGVVGGLWWCRKACLCCAVLSTKLGHVVLRRSSGMFFWFTCRICVNEGPDVIDQ